MNTVCASFSYSYYAFIYCSSLLNVFQLRVRKDRGGGLLSKKWTGIDKEREGAEAGKNIQKSFIDNLLVESDEAMTVPK